MRSFALKTGLSRSCTQSEANGDRNAAFDFFERAPLAAQLAAGSYGDYAMGYGQGYYGQPYGSYGRNYIPDDDQSLSDRVDQP